MKRYTHLKSARSRWLALLAILAFVPACSTIQKPIFRRGASGLDTIFVTDEFRIVHSKAPDSQQRVCAEPDSDAIEGQSQGEGVTGSVPGLGTEGLHASSSANALALGGRSPHVLITRELLYRACELSLNQNADLEDSLRIYSVFLDSLDRALDSADGDTTAPMGLQAPAAESEEDENDAVDTTEDATSSDVTSWSDVSTSER